MKEISELFAFYGLNGENFGEDMRLFIDEIYQLLIIDKSSQAEESQESEQLTAFQCLNRILRACIMRYSN